MSVSTSLQESAESKPIIKFLIVENPLKPEESTRVLEWEYEPGKTLDWYIGDLQGEWVFLRNRDPIHVSQLTQVTPLEGDVITIAPVPRGSTARQILAIAALVVLSYFTFGAGSASVLNLAGGGFWGYAAASAVFIGGSLVITSVLGLTPDKPDSFKDGTSYGIDGPKNTSRGDIPTPVVIGPYRMAGNIVALHTTNGEQYLGGKSGTQADWNLPYTSFTPFNNLGALLNGQGYTSTAQHDATSGEQFLYMLINAGEGEIEGIGEIEINEQPSSNFEQVEFAVRMGVDNQELIQAFNSILTPQSIAVAMDTDGVYTERQTLGTVDRVRVDVVFPNGLFRTRESDGDRRDTDVAINVEIKAVASGTWLNLADLSTATGSSAEAYKINKNTAEAVRMSFWSPKLTPGVYDVRVKRNNPPDARHITNMVWTDLWDITDEAIRYNFTALLAIKVRLNEQLNSIPNVTYIHKGIKLRNWNEATGAWQVTQTDNPAWVVWNFMTNTRWGAGLPESRLDLFSFRQWAIDCEALDLKFHGVFETEQSVWEQIRPVLRVGRAQMIRIGTKYAITMEKVKEPVMLFNVGNIIEGTFHQSWTPIEDRANQVEATYYDKTDGYRPKVVKVVDQAVQDKKLKPIPVPMDLIGVDNLAQAQIEAQFMLNTNKLISMVNFSSPLEALTASIGDVVLVQHDMPEWGDGGRCKSGSTTTVVQLDREVTIIAGPSYRLLVVYDSLQRYSGTVSSKSGNIVFLSGLNWSTIPTGANRVTINGVERRILRRVTAGGDDAVEIDDASTVSNGQAATIHQTDAVETRTVSTGAGTHTAITVSSALPAAPSQYAKWVFGEVNQNAVEYTVRNIKQVNDPTHGIRVDLTLLEYRDDVFDTTPGVVLPPVSYTTSALGPVTFSANPVKQSLLGQTQNVRRYLVTLYWTHDSFRYKDAAVYVSRNGSAFEFAGYRRDSFELEAEAEDVLKFRVVPRSMENVLSSIGAQPVKTYTVVEMLLEPPAIPTNFRVDRVGAREIVLKWGDSSEFDPSVMYELWVLDNAGEAVPVVTDGRHLDYTTGHTYSYVGLQPETSYVFWIRAVRTLDTSRVSDWAQNVGAETFADEIEYYIKSIGQNQGPFITESGVLGVLPVELQLRKITAGADEEVLSGPVKMYDPNGNELTVGNGYGPGSTGYYAMLEPGDINRSIVITARNGGPTGEIVDTIQCIDLTETPFPGEAVAYVFSPTLAWRRNESGWAPELLEEVVNVYFITISGVLGTFTVASMTLRITVEPITGGLGYIIDSQDNAGGGSPMTVSAVGDATDEMTLTFTYNYIGTDYTVSETWKTIMKADATYQLAAVRAWQFDSNTEGWTVDSGTFDHSEGTSFGSLTPA